MVKMPSDLIRITLDKQVGRFIIEYGKRFLPGLTTLQAEEMQGLEEELMEFQDFTLAEELNNKRRSELLEKKKRYEELQAISEQEHINWTPVAAELIQSVFLILDSDRQPIYVENLPSELIDKLLQPQIILNFARELIDKVFASAGSPSPEKISEPRAQSAPGISANLRRVHEVLDSVASVNWRALPIDVHEEGNVVFLKPRRFIKPDWTPLNNALQAAFGDQIWVSKGRGDKNAHWRIEAK
jgi:hypothetical protein